MSTKQLQKDWEKLSELDPLWAILSDRKKRHGKWNVNDFFQSGEEEVDQLIKFLDSKNINLTFGKVLDFGCGVGRVTIALSKYFSFCCGVDISPNMIKLAKQYNDNIKNCSFIINDKNNLSMFESNSFDFVYSYIVLQHILDKNDIKKYICEFIRILKPGGYSYFQLPSYISLEYRFQLTRRIYNLLTLIGFSEKFLYDKLNLCPIRMRYIPIEEIKRLVSDKAKIIAIQSPKSLYTKYLIQK